MAHLATLLILTAGIVFSLLRGLHVEQATVLALTLLALAPCRRAFYRKAALFTERFSSGWLLAVAAACSACSGSAFSAIGTSSTATICGGASWPRRMRLGSCARRRARSSCS